MEFPRILIGGTSSRVGKTLVSIGLMRALVNRGYVVQPYKVGPDFIDPSFHFFATGRPSRNLDSFMMEKKDIIEVFERGFKGADMAVIEGTMGFYDSHNAIDEKGSTAEISKILKCPVLLVANVERMSRTAASLPLGYKLFDSKVKIEGAILNRVGNERHARKVRLAVEKLAGIKVVGVIPRRKDVIIPDRHLGLIPAFERDEFIEIFDKLAEVVEKHVNVDEVINIAYNAPEIELIEKDELFNKSLDKEVKIGVFKDKVFTFYYQDNLDALIANGAEICYIDSLKDKKLPEVDALYIGGGFPEVFAAELEKNRKLRNKIYEFCNSGKPVYAECGGLMYLGKILRTFEKEEYEMVGFIPIEIEMFRKFQALGYSVYEVIKDNVISKAGDVLVGHEFHYSRVTKMKDKLKFAFRVKRGKGIIDGYDGIMLKNTLANYIHLHVKSYPELVKRFIHFAKSQKDKTN